MAGKTPLTFKEQSRDAHCGQCRRVVTTGDRPSNPTRVCWTCGSVLCHDCCNSWYAEEHEINLCFCAECYEGLKVKNLNYNPKLQVNDTVMLHFLNSKERNNTLGVIVKRENESGRLEVMPLRHIKPIPKGSKNLLVKKYNIIKLSTTVFYHFGEWVCSFCGCGCDCGITDNSPDNIRPHTPDCHHTMNSYRRKGPDCGMCYEEMTWSCCDGGGRAVDNERVAIHGCQVGNYANITIRPVHRIFPGDQRLRLNAQGRPLSREERIKLASDVRLEAIAIGREEALRAEEEQLQRDRRADSELWTFEPASRHFEPEERKIRRFPLQQIHPKASKIQILWPEPLPNPSLLPDNGCSDKSKKKKKQGKSNKKATIGATQAPTRLREEEKVESSSMDQQKCVSLTSKSSCVQADDALAASVEKQCSVTAQAPSTVAAEKFMQLLRQYECPLCLEPMACAVSLLPCGDVFCFTCLDEYLTKHCKDHLCPCCQCASGSLADAVPVRLIDSAVRDILLNTGEQNHAQLAIWEERVKTGIEARKKLMGAK